MPTNQEKEAFIKIFVATMRKELEQRGKTLKGDSLYLIAQQFVEALTNFKTKMQTACLSNEIELRKSGNLILWEENKEKLISEFAEKLGIIFKPVGGFGPGKKSAFFSGSELRQALPFLGMNIGSTLPGFVFNQVESLLLDVFFPKHLEGNIIETSTFIGLWAAFSELYAKGTANDAHLFLLEGKQVINLFFGIPSCHPFEQNNSPEK